MLKLHTDLEATAELDFVVMGRYPAETTEEAATLIEANQFASMFSGDLDGEKITPTIVTLDGPAGGAAIVAFTGPTERVCALFGAFAAQAIMGVEEQSAFGRIGQLLEQMDRESVASA